MTSGAHIHLLVNHVPVLAAPFALCFFVLALGRNSDGWLRGGLLLLVIALAGDAAAFLSGPAAVHDIVDLQRTSDVALEGHHARATYAMITAVIALVAAATAWFIRRKKPARSRWAAIALIAATLVHTLALAGTALEGGKVNHPELQDAAEQGAGPVHGDHHRDR